MTIRKNAPFSMLLLILCACLLAPANLACTGAVGPAALTLKSQSNGKAYEQQFANAYFSRADGGQYDAILIEDGIVNTKGRATGPLNTSASAPLSQIMHVRVLWQPLRGSKPDTPSATNAVIDWWVRSNEPGSRGDRLHYRGAGFVVIYDRGEACRFDIRSAHLTLTEGAGRMTDPLGETSVLGTFDAARNDGQVTATMNLIRSDLTTRPQQQSPLPSDASHHEGPPPRVPSEP
jgi:hypothetical protein